MTTACVTFDEASHTYRRDGVKVPGVTSILKPLYSDLRFVGADLLEWKSSLGKAVHRAVELHVKDDLVYDSLDPIVAAYFAQYLNFEGDVGFKPAAAEIMVYSSLGYAGTFDLLGALGKFTGLVDLKITSTLSPAVRLQTAAYQHAHKEMTGQCPKRYALRLTPDRYRLEPYETRTDTPDFAAFMGLLSAYRWCQANGAKLGDFDHV